VSCWLFRTLWGEGNSVADWGHRWVSKVADCGSKVCSFGQWAATNCAALTTANAGQYATSN